MVRFKVKNQCQSIEWNVSEMENHPHIYVFIRFDCYNFLVWFLCIEHPSGIINYKCLAMQIKN